MIGVAVVWLNGIGTIFYVVGKAFYGELRRAWVYTPVVAEVTSYRPARAGAEGEDAEPARIEYRYAVAGKTHEGKYSPPGGMRARDEYEPALSGPFEPGDELTAYYDPDLPAESTLNPAAQPFFISFLIFLSPLAAVGLFFLCVGMFGDPGRLGSEPGRRTALTASLGGPYVAVYAVVSGVSTFAFFFACTLLHWRTGIYAGFVLWLAGVPALTYLLVRLVRAVGARGEAGVPAPAAPAAAPLARKKLAGLIFVTVFCCGMTGAFAGFVLWGILRSLDAQRRYRPTEGVVLSSRVETHPDTDGPTYEPVVEYAYAVGGRQYTSGRYAFGAFTSSDYAYAAGVVAGYPEGKRVTVYYDPADPGESVLTRKVRGIHYFLLLFLQPFFLMSAGLMGYTASLPGRRRRVREFLARPMQAPCEIPTWGTLRQEMGGVAIQGGSLRLRLLAAVALGYGLPCFAGIFVLGIFFGGLGDPDPRAVGVVFAIAAGASVLAGLFALVATPTGKARLHIDTVLGRLSLTSRRRSVELSLSQVASWIVRPVPIALSHESGSELAFAPLLAVVTAGGEETPIHVFPADEEGARIARKAAEGFAEMTGKPVHVSAAPPAGAAGASGSILSEVMDWIRKASSAGKEYSDLT